ncbi:lysophospholipid acyltransferase family protein [Leptolyngbya sp. PCC 6406]|uniref:lysophospholipid acyltransferase family protein n=1 Tax=Leptolyngbya sp. PCC 6406 TaxID=1173264 RepID=UPI0002AC29D6|nr:1-acyl-sn-glycerol-3-phosphate acyltransferase [Leptolyngbya sp. PCC 6406]
MVALAPLPLWPELEDPLTLSRQLLQVMGTQVRVFGRTHIPLGMPLLVVSNHRSLIDVPVLMTALHQPIAFACHHYMANVPLLRDVVDRFGAFPLDTPHRRQGPFFRWAMQQMQQHRTIGIFPEGAQPMVKLQAPRQVNPFHRGFAHLALRAPVDKVALLPVALVSAEQGFESPIPLRLLSWFDPTEPLFQQAGGHPVLVYRRVEVRIGDPVWVTAAERQQYRGRRGAGLARDLTDRCWRRVHGLLQQGQV